MDRAPLVKNKSMTSRCSSRINTRTSRLAGSGLHRLVNGQDLGAVATPKFIQHQHFRARLQGPLSRDFRSSRNPTLAMVFRMRLTRCWLMGMYLS